MITQLNINESDFPLMSLSDTIDNSYGYSVHANGAVHIRTECNLIISTLDKLVSNRDILRTTETLVRFFIISKLKKLNPKINVRHS